VSSDGPVQEGRERVTDRLNELETGRRVSTGGRATGATLDPDPTYPPFSSFTLIRRERKKRRRKKKKRKKEEIKQETRSEQSKTTQDLF